MKINKTKIKKFPISDTFLWGKKHKKGYDRRLNNGGSQEEEKKMVKIYITQEAVAFLTTQYGTNRQITLGIFEPCATGWTAQNLFPFDVIYLEEHQIAHFPELIKIQHANFPPHINVYVQNTIIEDLPEPTIIDYVKLKAIDLVFVPIMAKRLETYHLYHNHPQKEG